MILAVPVFFYELSSAVLPKEKRHVLVFVATTLFWLGIAGGHAMFLPWLFTSALEPVSVWRPTIETYVHVTTRILLSFGCAFELPVVFSLLGPARRRG